MVRSDQNPSSDNMPDPNLVHRIGTESDSSTKGILVVHGMGDPPKGSSLYRWVNPIVDHISSYLGHEPKISSLIGEKLSEEEGPSSVTVEIDAGQEGKQTWIFAEAWWAKSFPTAKFDPALGWTFYSMIDHLWAFISQLGRAFVLAIVSVLLYFLFLARHLLNGGSHQARFRKNRTQYERLRGEFAVGYARGLEHRYLRMFRDLDNTDQKSVLEDMQREGHTYKRREHLRLLHFGANIFLFLNAPVMIVLLLMMLVLFIPGAILLTGLNLISGFPGVPTVVRGIKKGLDAFLLGSLGDIQVFLEERVQATQMREEVEKGLQFLYENNCSEINIIAHSTGVLICYEALNMKTQFKDRVKRFFSVGSTMRLAWQSPERQRSGLTTALSQANPDLKWFNFWARYDIAHPGPVIERYEKTTGTAASQIEDISVTNENSLLRDHVTYETNSEQVISRIVAEIWGDKEEEPFVLSPEDVRANDNSRIGRVLWLAYPRLVLLYLFPVLLAFFALEQKIAAVWSRALLSIPWEKWAETNLTHADRVKETGEALTNSGQALSVVIATALMMVAGYILYSTYKNLVWDRRGRVGEIKFLSWLKKVF